MPLHGLNSAVDTLVAQAAGSIGEDTIGDDHYIIELCSIYLLRARAIMTVFYIPATLILYLVKNFLPNVWMVSEYNRFGDLVNIGDTVALEHASIFIQYYFIGSYFACLNDL